MSNSKHSPWISGQINRTNDIKTTTNRRPTTGNLPKSSEKAIRGDEWDQIGLKELLAGEHDILYQGSSQYQDIQLIGANDVRMYLNEQLQFSSLDERLYHEAFVHLPMTKTRKRRRVLILGGGDGLALREVLKYRDVKHVDLVDIDPVVLNIAKTVPAVVKLNNGSMLDNRVNVHSADARRFIAAQNGSYDIIIVDFPDPADETMSNLYTKEFYELLSSYLAPDGILVCQANSPMDTPTVFWSIRLTLEQAGLYTMGYHTIIPSFGDWGFHMAAHKPLDSRIPKITVPHRTLPRNCKKLFSFSNEILAAKKNAEVNTSQKLTLHKIFQKEVVGKL